MSAKPSIPPTEFQCLKYNVASHIALVTLNRPERRNALNRRAYNELETAFRAASGDPVVRCVVVTGADPAFCSGEDVKEMMTGEKKTPPPTCVVRRPRPRWRCLSASLPVIAAVNGAAVGWGMELALYADIRLASEKASFAELFIRRGLICDVGGMLRLPAIVGPAKAAELLFTGDVIDAREAVRIGLVSEVTPHADLLPKAMDLAARIARNSPLALRFMKEGLRRTTHGDPRATGSWAIEAIHKLFDTEDHREGVRSFLEKREPMFTGR